jgi:hypothetical protein
MDLPFLFCSYPGDRLGYFFITFDALTVGFTQS